MNVVVFEAAWEQYPKGTVPKLNNVGYMLRVCFKFIFEMIRWTGWSMVDWINFIRTMFCVAIFQVIRIAVEVRVNFGMSLSGTLNSSSFPELIASFVAM